MAAKNKSKKVAKVKKENVEAENTDTVDKPVKTANVSFVRSW